jgi:hypothetical protein
LGRVSHSSVGSFGSRSRVTTSTWTCSSFHYTLNRFVVIELKADKFQPASLAQLGTYMAAIDDQIKSPQHAPTIGLLLCKAKNELLVEYALRSQTGPIGVADWAGALSTSLPKELASSLPSIEALEAELTDLGEDEK